MQVSKPGLDLIKSFEALELEAYWDKIGSVWTIGYGHTATAKKGMRITEAKALELLASDVKYASNFVDKHVKVPLNQGQYDALSSIIFNVGPGNSRKAGIIFLRGGSSSTLLTRLNAGDYVGAAISFKDWDNGGGKKVRGLTRRREAEFQMFLGERK